MTRGHRGPGYTLLTPDNHFASRLPSLPPDAVVYKLATPRLAPARFWQYLVVAGEAPVAAPLEPALEHFTYAFDGAFTYTPAGAGGTLTVAPGDRLIWLKRAYEPWPGVPVPAAIAGHRDGIEAAPTATPGLTRTELLPPRDGAFDFNMTLMRFAAGVGLPQVEIHDEEHGLYMTAGGGDYRLGDDVHPVRAHDFIYMAPYCPQGFAAGPDGAEYLLYKDTYRE